MEFGAGNGNAAVARRTPNANTAMMPINHRMSDEARVLRAAMSERPASASAIALSHAGTANCVASHAPAASPSAISTNGDVRASLIAVVYGARNLSESIFV